MLTERRRLVPEQGPRRTAAQMEDDVADELHRLLLGFEKVARRAASKDPRGNIADVRADDTWGAFFHLPSGDGCDDRFEAGHIIFQLFFMNWYRIMLRSLKAFFGPLEGQPPPMLVLLQSLHVGKNIDEEGDGGFDEATSLAMNGRQYFGCPIRLNTADISQLIYTNRLVQALKVLLGETITEAFNLAEWGAMTNLAEFLINNNFADLPRPPNDSPALVDRMHNAIWYYMDEVEEAAKEVLNAGTDEQSSRSIHAFAALSGHDKTYAAQCILLVAVINWFGLPPVAPLPKSPESIADSDSNPSISHSPVPLLDRGLDDDDDSGFPMERENTDNTDLDSLLDSLLVDMSGAVQQAERTVLGALFDTIVNDVSAQEDAEDVEDPAGAALDNVMDIVQTDDSPMSEDESEPDLSHLHGAGLRLPQQMPAGLHWVPLEDGLRELGSTAHLRTLQIEVAGMAQATFVAEADSFDSDSSDVEPDVVHINRANTRNRESVENVENAEGFEEAEGDMLLDSDMEAGRPAVPTSWSLDDRVAATHGRGPFLFVNGTNDRDMPDLGPRADSTRATDWAHRDGIIGGEIELYDIRHLERLGIASDKIWRPQEPENEAAPERSGTQPAVQRQIRLELRRSFGWVPPRRDWVPESLEECAFFAIRKSMEYQLSDLPTPSVTDLMVALTTHEIREEAKRRENGKLPQPLPHASGHWETATDPSIPALMAAVELYGKSRCGGLDLRLGIISDNRTPILNTASIAGRQPTFVWIDHDGASRVHRDGARSRHRYAALRSCETHGRASHYILAVYQHCFKKWNS
ncbi:hypothetical protein CMQ_5571 [Grosmannia clavigera kw1407]|uniref:Uncharacterized protein n=1 Tax=Grosmannia clavigera (strain kw1407 / UAMH 11150) TaxID=655863 RepID=F0XTC5_GROCL|nr:uncharacterized protein CMQ_5571 [Grosmannia clavigera kw1407]EFW99150.1 hypothetical protein CMQ_5571 [Grosmannia clavigera kw1407]